MSSDIKKQQSFLHGSVILIAATVIAKIIGAVYRIPLTNLLDSDGMGYYSTAYDLYVPMYSIAMAGLPIAISRMVAEYVTKSRYKDVTKTLHAAQVIFLVTGSVAFALLILLAFLSTGRLAFSIFGYNVGSFFESFNSNTLIPILAIAPSILFCCLMSAYRGYFEGLGNMTPTGVSEVIEASGKLLFGYTLAFFVLKTTGNTFYAAAGALIGVTIGEVFCTLYLFIFYKRTRWKYITREEYDNSPEPGKLKKYIYAIILIAIPIVLGSLVNHITSLIDVVMVQKQLANGIRKAPEIFETNYAVYIKDMAEKYAKENKEFSLLSDLPVSLYGCHRGFAFSIYNLIPVLTSTLGVSAIPVLARAWTLKDKKAVRANIQTMLRTVAIIAIPCGFGIIALAKPILSLLYSSKSAIDIAAPNLQILGLCAIFAGINAPLVNMLQAIGKVSIPLKNIAIGAVLKIVCNFILVGVPEINIHGVPVGTTVCYAFICIANLFALAKYSNVRVDYYSTLIKPLFAGIGCGVVAYSVNYVLRGTLPERLITVASIAVAGLCYLALLALFNIIKEEDVLTLPMGEKICIILKKFKIVR